MTRDFSTAFMCNNNFFLWLHFHALSGSLAAQLGSCRAVRRACFFKSFHISIFLDRRHNSQQRLQPKLLCCLFPRG